MLLVFLLSPITIIIVVIAIITGGLIAWLMSVRHKIFVLNNKVKSAWLEILGVLQKRFDLIPSFVETVKDFAIQEKEIINQLIKAQKLFTKGSENEDIEKISEANNLVSNALTRLIVVEETYHELIESDKYQTIKNKLSVTENKIAFTRTFYNDMVLNYNNQIEIFPINYVASIFKCTRAYLFEVKDLDKDSIKLKF